MKKYPVLLVFGLALMNVATVHAGSNSGLVNASALPWVHPASAIIHMSTPVEAAGRPPYCRYETLEQCRAACGNGACNQCLSGYYACWAFK